MAVTNFGLEHFSDNPYFNAYYGYMIKVKPYLFHDYNGQYEKWQNMGIGMMRKAFTMKPNDPFLRAMYWNTFEDDCNQEYQDACCSLWQDCSIDEWGNSTVQHYFFRILLGEIFAGCSGEI